MRKNEDRLIFTDTYFYIFLKIYVEMIFFVLWAILSVYILRWKWYMYPVAFFVGDIVYHIALAIVSKSWQWFYWDRLPLNKQIDSLSEQISDFDSYSPETDLMIDLGYDAEHKQKYILSLLKEKYRNLEEEEENKEDSNAELLVLNEEKRLFEKALKKITNEGNKDFFIELLQKINKIILLVEDKPSFYVLANKTFNIYMPEIRLLIQNIPIDETAQENYKTRLFNVIKELDDLTEKTISAIKNFNDKNAEIAFDVLTKEMRREGDELDGRKDN